MTEPRWIKLSERMPKLPYKYDIYFCNSYKFERCPWSNVHPPVWATHFYQVELPPLPIEEKDCDTNSCQVEEDTDLCQKPVDPDWIDFNKEYGRWDDDYQGLVGQVNAIYEFLKAKYGK